MKSRRDPIRSSFLVALAAASSLAVGCAQLPSQPLVEPGSVAAPVTVQHDGLISGVTDLLKGLLVRVVNIVGSVGGSVTNHRFKVVVPAGAIEGNAAVYVGVASATSESCQLEIVPASKNNFRKPVQVTVDCANVPLADLKSYGFFWFNPSTGQWVLVEGYKVDLNKKTVTAPLHHFSKYKVGKIQGKAGW